MKNLIELYGFLLLLGACNTSIPSYHYAPLTAEQEGLIHSVVETKLRKAKEIEAQFTPRQKDLAEVLVTAGLAEVKVPSFRRMAQGMLYPEKKDQNFLSHVVAGSELPLILWLRLVKVAESVVNSGVAGELEATKKAVESLPEGEKKPIQEYVAAQILAARILANFAEVVAVESDIRNVSVEASEKRVALLKAADDARGALMAAVEIEAEALLQS